MGYYANRYPLRVTARLLLAVLWGVVGKLQHRRHENALHPRSVYRITTVLHGLRCHPQTRRLPDGCLGRYKASRPIPKRRVYKPTRFGEGMQPGTVEWELNQRRERKEEREAVR